MLLSLGDIVAFAHYHVNLPLICRFSPGCQMVIYEISCGEIIDKQLLCVKHNYYTTFGVPKKHSHYGNILIQMLNLTASIAVLLVFSDK